MSRAKEIALAIKEAELARAEAEATLAEVEAYEAVKKSEAKEKRREAAEKDKTKDRTYRFTGQVNEDSVYKAVDQLQEWHKKNPRCKIRFVIDSPGGYVWDGTVLFDELASLSLREGGTHEVTTVVRGLAASFGAILLQAGDIRLAGRRSEILIHEASGLTYGTASDVEDGARHLRKTTKRMGDIFLARTGDKCSAATFNKKCRKADWCLTADEALGYGFIDGIG